MFGFSKIEKACKILNIEDRGEREGFVNEEGQSRAYFCSFCRARQRIGLKKTDSQPVAYCWKCVQLILVSVHYNSRPYEPEPKKKVKPEAKLILISSAKKAEKK